MLRELEWAERIKVYLDKAIERDEYDVDGIATGQSDYKECTDLNHIISILHR